MTSRSFQFDPQHYPTLPGVYLMLDERGQVLYVGKAINLRARLRSYFSSSGDSRPQVRFLLGRVRQIETIVTDTGKEALILENTLIKKHRPRYNINLRDDKTYVSLRLDLRDEFPWLQVVRKVSRDGALYFGPYASAGAVRETLKEIYRIFPLRHYPLDLCRRRGRPCLFHQIGQCSAPCHGLIGRAAYRQLVDGVIALLSGRAGGVRRQLQRRMEEASAALNFEEAARLRDQVRALDQTVERQKVVAAAGADQDVFGLHRQEGSVVIAVLFVRHGKLIGRRNYPLEWRLDEPELLASFLQEFYGREVAIPHELLLPLQPDDPETLGEWLSDRAGRQVVLNVPQRGDKKQLLEMANRNARETFQDLGRQQAGRERLLEELRDRLQLTRTPRRIECFDISNIQGAQSVGSMSVLVDGEAAKGEYRHYKIRSVSGSDDYASLAEVLGRRLQRGLAEEKLPDCILIDGGPGQLGILDGILRGMELEQRIDAVGIAKSRVFRNVRGKAVERSEERFFRPGRKNPIVLRQGSPALFLLENLRNEAHRFAITHHRKLRGKAALHSGLEEIPGVGPARRKLLLKHFGSLKKLREATLDELRQVPSLPAPLAETVFRHLHPA